MWDIKALIVVSSPYIQEIMKDCELSLEMNVATYEEAIPVLEKNIATITIIIIEYKGNDKDLEIFIKKKNDLNPFLKVVAFTEKLLSNLEEKGVSDFVYIDTKNNTSMFENNKNIFTMLVNKNLIKLEKQCESKNSFIKTNNTWKDRFRIIKTKLSKSTDLTKNIKLREIKVVCIGISTGGTAALKELLPDLGLMIDNFPVVLIAQHIPEGFSLGLVNNLNKISALRVHEAEDKQELKRGNIYIAPGNKNMIIKANFPYKPQIRIIEKNQDVFYTPSIDLLFSSVTEVFRESVLSILMTGMGWDGVEGTSKVYLKGGITLGQNKKSSAVYGMVKLAKEKGYIIKELNLNVLGDFINKLCKARGREEIVKILFNK